MENKIAFNPKWLKAASIIAARRDIRYYLNGVLVEVFEKEARLVATDGHRMVIFRKLIEGCSPTKFIIPIEIIDLLKVHTKHKIDATISYDPLQPLARTTLDYMSIGLQFTPIDGRFPEYTQTMNKACAPSGQISTFNPQFMADIKRCVSVAFRKDFMHQPDIWHNGSEPAAVTYKGQEDFFGIVMPMRHSNTYKPLKWTMPEEVQQPEEALA